MLILRYVRRGNLKRETHSYQNLLEGTLWVPDRITGWDLYILRTVKRTVDRFSLTSLHEVEEHLSIRVFDPQH